MNLDNKLAPTFPSERYQSLDLLRGLAVLGILIMNIQSFSMIQAAYVNPNAYGDFTGLNKIVWILSHVFADQKFMTIFSILFGAGIILFTQRAEAKGFKATRLHYRRTFWLLVIGLAHAHLLWHGDILVPYALCAFVVFLFRKKKPKTLFTIGIIFISVSSIIYILLGWSIQFWPPESIQETMVSWKPEIEIVAKELSDFRGSWFEQMNQRVPTAILFETFLFLIWSFWRAGGLMLVGMALFKWGILTAERANDFYKKRLLIGLIVGLAIIVLGLAIHFDKEFKMEYSFFIGSQLNYWGSLFLSFAYICIIMLLSKRKIKNRIIRSLEGVGRTAFSNYLLQTLICTTIFYGHGFGFFGKVEREIQILIVIAVWIFQIILTNIWLRYFRFGPVEWLWRSLTYWKIQPIKL
ncbi:MAG: DUF418 domain-containing protein [Ignavibacteria bacterium]|nr:DUF418 domain-containing protein [Ignavibacteria bacterium]MBT8391596.1 DUF418 domain-containing protein [Ignavibacteria bacterium]NNJ53729.1 DUF418 domain-containing protein [Ignavibacteriaceae bacterium]NNL21538.1 DUF418 domain-containing protein [Ignavibacteriaceae bacterium]